MLRGVLGALGWDLLERYRWDGLYTGVCFFSAILRGGVLFTAISIRVYYPGFISAGWDLLIPCYSSYAGDLSSVYKRATIHDFCNTSNMLSRHCRWIAAYYYVSSDASELPPTIGSSNNPGNSNLSQRSPHLIFPCLHQRKPPFLTSPMEKASDNSATPSPVTLPTSTIVCLSGSRAPFPSVPNVPGISSKQYASAASRLLAGAIAATAGKGILR